MPIKSGKFFQSIRFRIIFWYMLLLTLTLLAFSAILYGSFDKTLYGDFDDLLCSRADGVANSIYAYWHSREDAAPDDMEQFLQIARTWVEEKRKDPELMSIFVRILDPNGKCLVATKSTPSIASIEKEYFEDVLNGEDSFDTLKGELANAKKARFRQYTRPVVKDGKVMYAVQAAGPLGLVALAMKNLAFVLFILLPFTILLAGIPGVLLARLTLKPVNVMISTLRQITTENLRLKVHIPDTRDEMRRLAETFNDMIDRLERSFSSQQKFIQNISNELKIPMSNLKREIESILAGVHSEEKYRALLSKVSGEIEKFSSIIENLLVFSCFDDDQSVLEIRKTALNSVIEKAMSDSRDKARAKGVGLSFRCAEVIVLDADEVRLRQLFLNLIDNAIKYSYRKGEIVVTASKDGARARVAVSDTGIGIPKDEVAYIFDRFYQAVKSRSSAPSFGLGLTSAKTIVESHQGSIEVESEEGRGSTFTVSLPLSYPG